MIRHPVFFLLELSSYCRHGFVRCRLPVQARTVPELLLPSVQVPEAPMYCPMVPAAVHEPVPKSAAAGPERLNHPLLHHQSADVLRGNRLPQFLQQDPTTNLRHCSPAANTDSEQEHRSAAALSCYRSSRAMIRDIHCARNGYRNIPSHLHVHSVQSPNDTLHTIDCNSRNMNYRRSYVSRDSAASARIPAVSSIAYNIPPPTLRRKIQQRSMSSVDCSRQSLFLPFPPVEEPPPLLRGGADCGGGD
jgi:hypothetical protein